jgi:hypothetical protein
MDDGAACEGAANRLGFGLVRFLRLFPNSYGSLTLAEPRLLEAATSPRGRGNPNVSTSVSRCHSFPRPGLVHPKTKKFLRFSVTSNLVAYT